MKTLKIIKTSFSKEEMKKYKNKFKNKQIQFAFSKIALIFNESIDPVILIKGEKILLKEKKGEGMFKKTFSLLKDNTDSKIDWEAFASLMWYSYQTSTYWKDSKKNIKNIFNKNNYVEKNEEKRSYYYIWLNSIPKTTKHYNIKILKTLKVVF